MNQSREQRDASMFGEWATRFADHGGEASPLIPAATVVVLRDGDRGLETLMLRRNSRLEFVGGMWVFPGGRIDPDDYPDGDRDDPGRMVTAARNAAVREANEEAGQHLDPGGLAWFSHWTPPGITPKRFSTWFFAGRASEDPVAIDGGEIHDAGWMTPTEAMTRRNDLEIELAPPTWVTLETLTQFGDVDGALHGLGSSDVQFFETRIATSEAGPVALWEGDAGYETGDAELSGPRHRLVMAQSGYIYQRPTE